MKKGIAVLVLFAVLLTATACGKKIIYFDPEEYDSAVAEYEKSESESMSEREEKVSENLAKIEKDLGKTKENKQLVYTKTYDTYKEYHKIVFDKDGLASYELIYEYCNDDSRYDNQIKFGDGNAYDGKIVDSDREMRYICYKKEDIDAETYTYEYNLIKDKTIDSTVYAIVE